MENSKIIPNNSDDSNNEKEFKYSNNRPDFNNILSIPLILNQVFLFIGRDDIKSLSLCNKKLYQQYCKQIKKITLIQYSSYLSETKLDKYENTIEFNVEKSINLFQHSARWKDNWMKAKWRDIIDISFLKNNKNLKILNLYCCKNIKDFSLISFLEKLEELYINVKNITDISFLKTNKNIKILNLRGCKNIKDFSPLSYLEKLEDLDIRKTSVSEISFLRKNKNIKKLNLERSKNIEDSSPLSYLEKLEDLNLYCTKAFAFSCFFVPFYSQNAFAVIGIHRGKVIFFFIIKPGKKQFCKC